jgi:hypothetical protein
LFCFLAILGLNSGLFVLSIFEIGSHELFAQASFETRSSWSLHA